MENDEILARVQVSQGRRLMGVAMLVGLGAMLLYLSVVQPPAGLGWRVFLVVFGVLAVFLGVRMHTATALDLELTADVLRDSSGTVYSRSSLQTGSCCACPPDSQDAGPLDCGGGWAAAWA